MVIVGGLVLPLIIGLRLTGITADESRAYAHDHYGWLIEKIQYADEWRGVYNDISGTEWSTTLLKIANCYEQTMFTINGLVVVATVMALMATTHALRPRHRVT